MPRRKVGDYEIGKGKPPVATRFQKGRSGNPSGRPKGSVSLVADLEAELRSEVTVTENGRELTLTKQRLFVKSVVSRAVKGDRHATQQMIDLMARTMGVTTEPEAAEQPLTAEDQEVLDAFKAELAQRLRNHHG
ncbi:DUF5681 domain-containing protein [Phenylobacterium sp.]|uniref:DUF5681 domain-containing protein n=1 Tax=Phenylobacterium sp. TaxID=1871053 RepID=UPI002600BCAC|nr:DUF5681 domain-containing protein [Phenylobacterium sp.]MBX3482411.1 hypothetical protein [Phenylobacterium sp.]MCW5758205.1 hypothetical protein [Phenylobacterium sp.]